MSRNGMDDERSPEEATLVEQLQALAQDPSTDARARIMAAVRQAPRLQAEARRRPAWLVVPRFRLALALATGLLTLIVGSTGALAASSEALPDSPAYGLRLVGERIRIDVAGPGQRVNLSQRFAADRLRQARDQLRIARAALAAKLVADSRAYLQEAQADLVDLPEPQQTEDAAEDVRLEHEAADTEAAVAVENGGPPAQPALATPNQSIEPSPANSGRGVEPSPSPGSEPGPGPDSPPSDQP